MGAMTTPLAGDLNAKLRFYYARFFPIELMTRWLRYGSDSTFSHREISFVLAGDIYLRWKSFGDKEALQKALKSLAPVKIDIGAIYNQEPASKNSTNAQLIPMQKELVFDIDMTDYKDVMKDMGSLSETQICDNNWEYMAVAVQIIDTALREDFGFENIMWVYSGRRGIHCWVGDERARNMSSEQRSAVADFLHIRFEGRENRGRRQTVVTNPLHPSLKRAKRICEDVLVQILEKQQLLSNENMITEMVDMIPHARIRMEVLDKMLRVSGDTQQIWDKFEKEVMKAARNEFSVRGVVDYVVLRYCYPRLDVNVSRDMGHLLKAPFCVHPKTGRVCIPFRAKDANTFNPEQMAPVLDGLLQEEESGESEMKTRLKEGVAVLEEFVTGLEMEVRLKQRTRRMEEVDREGVRKLMSD